MSTGKDDLVPELPGDAKASPLHPAIHDHGAAYSRAQCDADQAAFTLASAKAPLRPGRGIGVIGEQHGTPQ
ncbi:hypothetical protein D3C73_1462690 [compost metagenome]